MTLGSRTFYKNEPVLYFDTLRTSTLEGASTTVYAQGGRGYARLISWDGEKTITFTMEDALLSPESFSILSGAGLVEASEDEAMYVHQTSQVQVGPEANTIVLPALACWNKTITTPAGAKYTNGAADIFVMVLDNNGEVDAEPCIPAKVEHNVPEQGQTTITCYSHEGNLPKGDVVLVDYYVLRTAGAKQLTITAESFSGNFYIEASTLFRRQSDGVDMPAEFIIPNGKVQSNFTFTMAANGDPSVFSFTVDAFPDYTKFDPTERVFAAIQIIDDEEGDSEDETREPCAPAGDGEETVTTFQATINNTSSATIEEILLNDDSVLASSESGTVIPGVKGGDTIEITLDTAATVNAVNGNASPGTSATEHTIAVNADVSSLTINITD